MATTATVPARKAQVATTRRGQARAEVSQMETFVWVGKDKRGQSMKGEYAAKNISLVKAELRRQGISPTSVKAKPKPLFGAAGKKITTREIAVFSRQISVMMQAGVPLVQGLDIIAGGQANVRMKNMLTAIKTDIEGGSTLYEALAKFPVQFDELFVNLVKAGEAAGVLDTVLDTIATYKENIESLKGKIRKALFYPAIVFAVALLVSAILLIFVVPQFESVFKNFGADLPAFTQMIVTASRFTTAYWYIVLLGTIAFFGILIFAYKRSPAFAHFCARAVLKLPVIGQILHQSAIARFARTLGVTFRAGVPLVEALDSVAGATGSPIYNAAVKCIREDVAIGHQLQLAMRQAQLFQNMVVQMVAVGEQTGAMDTMLGMIADFYEDEVDTAVAAMTSLLEPMMMVVLGGAVGGLLVAMYLPIFKIAENIK